jgi:hypothetical protein
MSERSVSWVGTISEELEERGPVSFSRRVLEKQSNLFAHRSALSYTSTENISAKYVGSGPMDIMLSVVPPDYTDAMEVRAYRSPRLWLDLIQRQTGKLRWTPISPARVTFVRYDCFRIRWDHLTLGTKGLLDALKIRASGRRDGTDLHYFGAIVDDAPEFVEVRWEQRLVARPKDARVRVTVFPVSRALR